ncbi:MAG: methylated-DNA--[protein]-cysteine S-methyltransferase [Symbiobacteriia bacterium]
MVVGSENGAVVYVSRVDTPLGRFVLAATDAGLCRLLLPSEREEDLAAWVQAQGFTSMLDGVDHAVSRLAREELAAYGAGQLRQFTVPLDLRGTAFQRRVWTALLQIPFGETRSYGQVAASVGNPRAVRAIGGANHNNPVAIVVPCHRVIGASGSLVGYGGGLALKERLLAFEQSLAVAG